MKRYIALIIILLSLSVRAQTDSLPSAAPAREAESGEQPASQAEVASNGTEELWNRANTAYINANYRLALTLYDSLAATEGVSYKLYYNLGNAYFKLGANAKAILYYNKALRLAPTDGDTEYNLSVANANVKDKIEQVPEFFFSRWMRALRLSLSSDTWTWISLGLLAAALVALLFYLLSRRMGLRKTGFYGGILCTLLFIAATAFAVEGRRELHHPDEGIVMGSATAVKSSPDQASKDLFVLHEGTKVKVVSEFQQWREVMIADGKKGWIEASGVEMI